MSKITLAVVNQAGAIQKSRGANEQCYLDYLAAYQPGDWIQLQVEVQPAYYVVQLDEALAPALIYLKSESWCYSLPLDSTAAKAYSSKAFKGQEHYLTARVATIAEVKAYQNLAVNSHDQLTATGAFPHATANTATQNESTYFPRNSIDGIIANQGHGSYPYQAWGVNQQSDASLRIDFGREVKVHQIALILRSTYPCDSYWEQATIAFSDGTTIVLQLNQVLERQMFKFYPRIIQWLELKELIKAKDASPFPALTQIEVFGENRFLEAMV